MIVMVVVRMLVGFVGGLHSLLPAVLRMMVVISVKLDLKGNGKERMMVKIGMRMRCRKKMLVARMRMIVEVMDVKVRRKENGKNIMMGMKRKCKNRKMVKGSLVVVTVVMVLGGMIVLIVKMAR